MLESQEFFFLTTLDLRMQNLFLLFVLVANVKDPLLRAGKNAGENHPFDHEMRKVREDEAIFECSGLAFICVADDVFLGAWSLANELPFRLGGKSGAAQSAESGSFQSRERAGPIARFHQSFQRAIALAFWIRIGGAAHAIVSGRMFRQRDARKRIRNHRFDLILRDVAVDMPVDRHRRRFIATAEAGHTLHLHFRIRGFAALCVESGAKLGGIREDGRTYPGKHARLLLVAA